MSRLGCDWVIKALFQSPALKIKGGNVTLEDPLVVSIVLSLFLEYDSAVVLWYLLELLGNLDPHKSVHMNAYSSLI